MRYLFLSFIHFCRLEVNESHKVDHEINFAKLLLELVIQIEDGLL